MINNSITSLSSYLTRLLASGRVVFRSLEAQESLRIGRGAFLDAAERLQKKGVLVALRQGFYVVVPPQYLELGCPPPSWFIDELMCYQESPYYVGLLKAAELHGAAHHAVMEFQVVTTRQLKPIRVGRTRITFAFRKDLTSIGAGITSWKTDTGAMNISSPELTLLDLFRYPQAAGGIDTIFSVINELGPKILPDKFEQLAGAFESSILQRAGFLLERAGFGALASALHAQIEDRVVQPVELDRGLVRDRELAPPIIEQNKRWQVIVRKMPENDQ